jgi:hypothetical protein
MLDTKNPHINAYSVSVPQIGHPQGSVSTDNHNLILKMSKPIPDLERVLEKSLNLYQYSYVA